MELLHCLYNESRFSNLTMYLSMYPSPFQTSCLCEVVISVSDSFLISTEILTDHLLHKTLISYHQP